MSESTGPPGGDSVDDGLRSPARIEALSDGVFAIILTLLVLEIAVPTNLSSQSLREVLVELRPTLAAWVISFLITGMYWVSHRDLFARIRVVNRDLVWLNLLFLLPVSLIPFAASVLGEYPDEPIALHIYGVILIAVTLMRVAMYWYVGHRPHLFHDQRLPGRFGLGAAISAAPLVLYAAAMAVATASTTAGVWIYLSVPFVYFVGLTLLRERPGTRAGAEEFS
jgi:TMEM175 potassium channel family protein